MGMFDNLEFEEQPPELPEKNWWQTKDFDCVMDSYLVTKDGNLLRRGEPVNFHGMVYIIGGEAFDYPRFSLKFTDGKLMEITPISEASYRLTE